MRTIYLGTSAFAAAILRTLAEGPHRPSLVVTRPDRPRGRGRRLAAPPVADAARELGIALDQPESVNDPDAVARIEAHAPEAICVCAFGALIREPLLSLHPIVNVHPSLLPRWRGAAPVERAIIAGDSSTGVSIMRLTAGLDSGPVFLQAPEPIRPDDTYGSLAARLETLGAELLLRVLDQWPEPVEQDESRATYAEKISSEDRRLEPERAPAADLERTVRALEPHIGAFLILAGAAGEEGGGRLGVRSAQAHERSDLAPGELSLHGPRPLVGCTAGALELLVVQPPGRRAMSGEDYLRGHRG